MSSRFCVVGATSGTGLLITEQLLASGETVGVVARDPAKADQVFANRVCVTRGDVTDPLSMRRSIDSGYQAIFFTVAARGGIDGRGLFESRAAIREVTCQGLINVADAARLNGFKGRLIVASLLGVGQSSLMIRVLNVMKPGLIRNLIERESYVRSSGIDYSIVRAPVLINGRNAEGGLRVIGAAHPLSAGSAISRGDLARVMILSAKHSAGSHKTFGLVSARGPASSDEQLIEQMESIQPES